MGLLLCAFWHGAAAQSPTAFDPPNTSPDITLSGSNLIATQNTTAGGFYNSTRSVANYLTGKLYNEFTYNSVGTCPSSCVGLVVIGVGNVNAPTALGLDNNAVGMYDNGGPYLNGSSIGTAPTFTTGNTVGMAVDFAASLIWFTKDGTNWNAGGSANPATGVGGFSFSAINVGPFYAYAATTAYSGVQLTANFGATAYNFTRPAGFSNWLGAGTGGGGGHIFNPQAVASMSFIKAIGFNGYGGNPNSSQIISDFATLGIPGNYRSNAPDPVQSNVTAITALAAAGIKLDFVGGSNASGYGLPSASTYLSSNFSSEIDPLVTTYPGSVNSLEGPNEINNFPVVYTDTFATNSTTAAGNPTLHFAATPLAVQGVANASEGSQMTVLDYTSILAAVDNNGTAHYAATSTSVAPKITINHNNEVLLACVAAAGGPVTGITDSLSLTWHKRAATGGANDEEEWYALGPTSGTPETDTITITQTSSAALTADVWGAIGVNTSSPFDGSAVTGTSPILITTTHANTMPFGCFQGSASGSAAGVTIGATTPFLLVAGIAAGNLNGSTNTGGNYGVYQPNLWGADGQVTEFGLYTSTQTNLSIALGALGGTPTATGGVVDALVMNSATLLAITPGTTVSSATSTSVTLGSNAAAAIGSGDNIQFQAYYSVLANPASGLAWQGLIYSTTHGDANLSGAPVINLTDFPNAGVAGTADYNNQHFYGNTGTQPGWQYFRNTSTVPGKPEQVTETGWYTCPDSSAGVDNRTQMLLLFNDLFDIYNAGDPYIYVYELVDGGSDPGCTNTFLHFGIFDSTNTAKPAATALANLVTILTDTGSFSPGMLNYGITGLPSRSVATNNAGANSILFEKHTGNYYILIWNEAQIWNATNQTDVTPPTSSITVTFGRTCTTVNVYDPVVGTSPINTASNVSSIGASLIADPLIVECAP